MPDLEYLFLKSKILRRVYIKMSDIIQSRLSHTVEAKMSDIIQSRLSHTVEITSG